MGRRGLTESLVEGQELLAPESKPEGLVSEWSFCSFSFVFPESSVRSLKYDSLVSSLLWEAQNLRCLGWLGY